MFTYYFLCVILTACTHVRNIPHVHMLYYISLCIHTLLIIRNMYRTLGFLSRVFTSIAWNLEYEKLILFCLHPPLFTGVDPLSSPGFLLPLLPPKPHVFWHLLFFRLQFLLQQASWWLWLYYILFYFFVTKEKKPHTMLWCSIYSSEPLWV